MGLEEKCEGKWAEQYGWHWFCLSEKDYDCPYREIIPAETGAGAYCKFPGLYKEDTQEIDGKRVVEPNKRKEEESNRHRGQESSR